MADCDDDLLDAELMRAFECYDDDNSDAEFESTIGSGETSQISKPASESAKPVALTTNTSSRVPSLQSRPNVSNQLEAKKARVLENLRKYNEASSFSTRSFTGPKYFDKFSGFTVGNPLISQDDIKTKMEGKLNIKLASLKEKIRSHSLSEVNYVVFGVVSRRYQPKSNGSGKSWCTFLISDLHFCSLRFTVFHADHNQLYKEGEGAPLFYLTRSSFGLINEFVQEF